MPAMCHHCRLNKGVFISLLDMKKTTCGKIMVAKFGLNVSLFVL